MNYCIENEYYRVSISNIGGTITSITDKNRDIELVHQVEDFGWNFQDIVAFPIIGTSDYTVNENPIKIRTRHGFIRDREFKVLKVANNTLAFIYNSTEKDEELFPYRFCFKIMYSLENGLLICKFHIDNFNKNTMYFHLSKNLGIKVDPSTEIDLCRNDVYHPLNSGVIDLSKKERCDNILRVGNNLFQDPESYVFINKTNKIIVNTKTHRFTYNLYSPLISLFGNPITKNFLCVEPWWGCSEYKKQPKELSKCKYVNAIGGNRAAEYQFSIFIQSYA